jgi:signal transduction histidine kinase/streptogramin lyase
MKEDKFGRIWTGSWSQGLLCFDPKTGKITRHKPDKGQYLFRWITFAPALTGDSILWCMDAERGVYLFNVNSLVFTVHLKQDKNQPFGLPHDRMFSCMTDSRGLLWMTGQGGLSCVDPYEQDFFTAVAPSLYFQGKNILQENTPNYRVLQTGQTRWQVLNNKSLLEYAHETDKVLQRHDFVSTYPVAAAFPPVPGFPGGFLSIGVLDTLMLFDLRRRRFSRYYIHDPALRASNYYLRCFTFTKPGTLWIGTNGGLVKFDLKTRRVVKYYKPEPDDEASLPNHNIDDLDVDAEGQVWIAAWAGIAKLDPATGKITRYMLADGTQRAKQIYSVEVGRRGEVWALSRLGGLVRLDPETRQTRIFTPETEAAFVFLGLYLDRVGRSWITSANGLYCFDPETERFTRFTKKDGLPQQDFQHGPEFHAFDDGVALPGRNGLFGLFKPDNVRWTEQAPVVLIEKFSIMDRPVSFDRDSVTHFPLTLRYDDRYLRFSFTTPSFTRRHHLLFRYRMGGLDTAWQISSGGQTAVFGSLPPGNYTFQAEACPNGGNWSSQPVEFRLTVLPPWWQWRSVWAGGIMFLCGLAVAFYRFRLRQKEALLEKQAILLENQRLHIEREQTMQQERNRIASELHDDLGSGLSTIRFLSERALKKEEDPAKRLQVEKISRSAAELVERMRDIIWAMNAHNDSLENLLSYLRAHTLTYLEMYGIDCQFDMLPDIPDIPLSGEKRRNVLLVVKECLHNIIRHARATQVKVQIRWDNTLNISLHDNGVGFEEATANKGNGLLYMRRRMQGMGGSLNIEQKDGTLVRITVGLA